MISKLKNWLTFAFVAMIVWVMSWLLNEITRKPTQEEVAQRIGFVGDYTGIGVITQQTANAVNKAVKAVGGIVNPYDPKYWTKTEGKFGSVSYHFNGTPK